jgi:aryl-alcohol dehydrogenase-like predicted oxidoreductase
VKELQLIAERLEISLTQLSLGYCLKNPNVSTIILGATKEEQLEENLTTLNLIDKITDNTIKDINKVLDK